MSKKISISELAEWQKEYDLNLPKTDRGIAVRAKQEQWEYEEVAGRGGPGGVKKVYTLPSYVIEELSQKGLLHLLDKSESASVAPIRVSRPRPTPAVGVPSFMRPMVAEYDDWAAEQDTGTIVPVRYHVNVFGSAGNGYIFNESLETQAMWFRASFFNVLGVKPEKCFCTRVKGDSMYPTLIDRGTVLWQMQDRYTVEGIYLFRQVEELRIKRLQRVNAHTFRIISDNRDMFPVETLDLREMQDYEFEIYGKYLWDCAIRP
ncbi:S24 family peptidase [Wielerella bovis]|uniref:S24 family peptidase n=1 Tax=Wielerella bovis TaxID=2917790 RepID=UPI002019E398|nr:S24 family peptidase [Wielerella bovis]ULJ63244.1 S24 family peptidase [Wielerella bovis]